MVTKTFKCAGKTYAVNDRTTITQAKKDLKREAKESIEYLKDIERAVGLTPDTRQRMRELRKIVRGC